MQRHLFPAFFTACQPATSTACTRTRGRFRLVPQGFCLEKRGQSCDFFLPDPPRASNVSRSNFHKKRPPTGDLFLLSSCSPTSRTACGSRAGNTHRRRHRRRNRASSPIRREPASRPHPRATSRRFPVCADWARS